MSYKYQDKLLQVPFPTKSKKSGEWNDKEWGEKTDWDYLTGSQLQNMWYAELKFHCLLLEQNAFFLSFFFFLDTWLCKCGVRNKYIVSDLLTLCSLTRFMNLFHHHKTAVLHVLFTGWTQIQRIVTARCLDATKTELKCEFQSSLITEKKINAQPMYFHKIFLNDGFSMILKNTYNYEFLGQWKEHWTNQEP